MSTATLTSRGTARGAARPRSWSNLPAGVRRGVVLIVLLIIWQLYASSAAANPLLFSGPIDVVRALVEDRSAILAAVVGTLRVLLMGMGIGVVVAFVLATIASLNGVAADTVGVISSMLNPLPAIAILPLAVTWFGFTTTALVATILHAVVWPITLNTHAGFRAANPSQLMVARSLGLKGITLVYHVLWRCALPHILTGLRTGWAFGWRTIVAAELVFGVASAQGGIGWYIYDAKTFLNTSGVFAGLVVIATIGLFIEMGFSAIERLTIDKWGMRS